MTRGFVIFAFDNAKVNYFKHAVWTADRIQRFLNLPTTIVTDTKSSETQDTTHSLVITDAINGGQRNFDLGQCGGEAKWFNVNRYQAYDHSPYDETIVLDSDYIVNSNQLLKVFETQHDVLFHRDVYDITGRRGAEPYRTFGHHNFPHYWATVLFFRKGEEAKNFFLCMDMVKSNYTHYSKIYKFHRLPYRSDFATSIALSMIYGLRIDAMPTIPWNLQTAFSDVNVIKMSDTEYKLVYENWNRITDERQKYQIEVKDIDIHCIDKHSFEAIVNE